MKRKKNIFAPLSIFTYFSLNLPKKTIQWKNTHTQKVKNYFIHFSRMALQAGTLWRFIKPFLATFQGVGRLREQPLSIRLHYATNPKQKLLNLCVLFVYVFKKKYLKINVLNRQKRVNDAAQKQACRWNRVTFYQRCLRIERAFYVV